MGWQTSMIYHDWCWVAEVDGVTCAALITIPAHGALLLLRIAANKRAPMVTVRAILTHAFKEARDRGLIGYLAWTEPCTKEGQTLLGIVRKIGGKQSETINIMSYGTLTEAVH
jgi:hypothetical protein